MGGRHKNFEDPMPYELRKRINKFRNVTFFMGHPLSSVSHIFNIHGLSSPYNGHLGRWDKKKKN